MVLERLLAVGATLVVGGIVAFQPPVNALLARQVSVVGAACLSTGIATLLLVILYVVLNGGLGGLAEARHVPWWHLTGGFMGAVLVTVSLVTVTRLGAGGVVAATVLGQLTVSLALDATGALGLERAAVTPTRLLGVVLLLAGTALVVRT